ncbi:hypothetical protein CP533_2385 [Ophiocordyceps camponoti-saundersi (nom. inval.)]|nr:hypothetical protein CP533_2385 [Ophiocordyceps camponoti-saundersi (nom. inval.)]
MKMRGRFALQAFLFALCLLLCPSLSHAKPTGLEKRFVRGNGFPNRGGSSSGRMNDLRLNDGRIFNNGRFGQAVNVVIDRQRALQLSRASAVDSGPTLGPSQASGTARSSPRTTLTIGRALSY